MNDKLYNWLEEHWRLDNHPKYRNLFLIWVKNITPSQIDGFIHDMELEEIFKKGL